MKLDDENAIIEWDFKNNYIFFSIPSANQELIYENGHLLYYLCGRLIHEYKKPCKPTSNTQTPYRVNKFPKLIKSRDKSVNNYLKYQNLPTHLKAFSKMSDFEIVNYYIDTDKENMNVQRLAIMENEMLKRNLNNFTHQNTRHDVNDILSLKNEFVERGLSYYEF